MNFSLVPQYDRTQHVRSVVHSCANDIRARRKAEGLDDGSSVVGEVTATLAGTPEYQGFDIYEVEAVVRDALPDGA